MYIFLISPKADKLFPINLIGLINDFFFLFVTNSYISSVFAYFDLVYIYKLIKRFIIKKINRYLNQKELNKLY